MNSRNNARRAHRLTNLYPAAWRQRYGTEFQAHMEQEFQEKPHSMVRTSNVVTMGLVTRIKVITWRLLLMQPREEKFKGLVLLPIAAILGVAVAAFSGWPHSGRSAWPAQVLIGVLFVFIIYGMVHDSHRIRTTGPAKRFSKERLVPLVFILANTLPFLFRNEIGQGTLLLYLILLFDIFLFAFKFGWLGRKHASARKSLSHGVQGKSNI